MLLRVFVRLKIRLLHVARSNPFHDVLLPRWAKSGKWPRRSFQRKERVSIGRIISPFSGDLRILRTLFPPPPPSSPSLPSRLVNCLPESVPRHICQQPGLFFFFLNLPLLSSLGDERIFSFFWGRGRRRREKKIARKIRNFDRSRT